MRAAEPHVEDGGRYLNYPAFAFDEAKQFETYRIVIKPQGSLSAQPHLKGAQNTLPFLKVPLPLRRGIKLITLTQAILSVLWLMCRMPMPIPAARMLSCIC